jgi:hypothetical protein
MDNYIDILQNLYLGTEEEVDEVNNIHLLINCSIDILFPKNRIYPMQIRIPVEEDEKDSIKLLEMILYTKTIEKIYDCLSNKQIVYIFSSGIQRSSAVITCFLIKYMQMKPLPAIRFLCDNIHMHEDEYIFMDTIQYYYQYLDVIKVKKNKSIKNKNQKIDRKKEERLIQKIQYI